MSESSSNSGSKAYKTWEKLAVPFALATGAVTAAALFYHTGLSFQDPVADTLLSVTGLAFSGGVGGVSTLIADTFMKAVTGTRHRRSSSRSSGPDYFIMDM